jgi:hypothetical protein
MKLLDFVDSVKSSYKGKNETINFYFMRNQLADLWWTVRENDYDIAKHTMFHLQNIHHSDDFKRIVAYYWYHFIVPSYQTSDFMKDKKAFYKDIDEQVEEYLNSKPTKKIDEWL